MQARFKRRSALTRTHEVWGVTRPAARLEPPALTANDLVHDQLMLDTMATDKKKRIRNHTAALKAQMACPQ